MINNRCLGPVVQVDINNVPANTLRTPACASVLRVG